MKFGLVKVYCSSGLVMHVTTSFFIMWALVRHIMATFTNTFYVHQMGVSWGDDNSMYSDLCCNHGDVVDLQVWLCHLR